MRAVSVAVRQYANGVNKGTLSANVAKVEAKEKELAAAKAAAKVLPTPIIPPITPARAHCFLQGFCAREMRMPDWGASMFLGGRGGRGKGVALARCKAMGEDSIISPIIWHLEIMRSPGGTQRLRGCWTHSGARRTVVLSTVLVKRRNEQA